MNDIIIRLYQEGDERGIVELLTTVFNPWPQFDITCSPLEHWIWKHKDNPLGQSIIVVAKNDDQIVGLMHSQQKKVKIGEIIVPAISGLDEATHPDFRGRGIYSRIREIMYQERESSGVKYTYGGTTNPILIESSKRRGESTYPHNLKTFVKIYDIDLYLKKNPRNHSKILKYGYLLLNLYNELIANLNRKEKENKNIKIENIEKFNEKINDFCDTITLAYKFIIQRNQEYLNWRYADKRAGNYNILQAKENDEVIGYIVIRVNKSDPTQNSGFIVDLITLPKRADAAYLLIKKAIEMLEKENVNIITTIEVLNGNYMKTLRSLGFLNSRQMTYVTYKYYHIDEEIEKFRASPVKKTHLVYGDYDWI